jgi:hypothetical protein
MRTNRFRFQDTRSGTLPPHRSVQAVLLSCSFTRRLLPIAGITLARALNDVASQESRALRAQYAHGAPCHDYWLLRHIVSPQLVVLTSSCQQTCLAPFKQFGSNQGMRSAHRTPPFRARPNRSLKATRSGRQCLAASGTKVNFPYAASHRLPPRSP